MTEIRIDIRGAAAMAKAFERAPDVVRGELVTAATEASLLLEREVKEGTPTGVGAGGGLRGSIAAREPRVLGDNVIGEVGTPLNYAVPVELGTRPHFPPVQPLADWAEFKLGVPREEAGTVGFLIARKIAREGTEGAFMFQRAFDANEPQVQRIFEGAQARIAERIGTAP